MRIRKMLVNVMPSACAFAVLLSSGVFAQEAQSAKDTSTKAAIPIKELKPQTTCPVQGDPINKKLFVDYKGKRIYVCCEGCIAAVKKDPETYIKKLEDMGQSVETIAIAPKKGAKPTKDAGAEAGYWTCPMHPEIHQAVAGKCPICGMNLEFKKAEKDTTKMKAMGEHKAMKM